MAFNPTEEALGLLSFLKDQGASQVTTETKHVELAAGFLRSAFLRGYTESKDRLRSKINELNDEIKRDTHDQPTQVYLKNLRYAALLLLQDLENTVPGIDA
jgi:hypothetical protein